MSGFSLSLTFVDRPAVIVNTIYDQSIFATLVLGEHRLILPGLNGDTVAYARLLATELIDAANTIELQLLAATTESTEEQTQHGI